MRLKHPHRRFPDKYLLLIHRHFNYSRIPNPSPQLARQAKSVLSSEDTLYNHLLQICLQQCKGIKTHNLFDENPERVSQASRTGKKIHAQSLKFGFSSKGLLANAVVDLYAKCGDLYFAEKAFHRVEKRDILPWNSILSMYSRRGLFKEAVKSFGSLWNCGVSPNEFTYAIVLSACARLVDLGFGRQVHCDVIKTGYELSSFSEGALIDMYAKCSCLGDARKVFDRSIDPDTVSWTAMISGYVEVGLPEDALKVFDAMQEGGHVPDQVAVVTAIGVCVSLGRLKDACELFARMSNPNVVAWNVLISGHAQRGFEVDAIKLFQGMREADVKPTRSTLGSVLSATACLLYYDFGVQVHALALKLGLYSNVYVGSSLINMYSKCKHVEVARNIFDALDDRNAVFWNAMLGGYVQNGYAHEVLNLFTEMVAGGFHPDEYTYTSVLSACAGLEYLEMGQQFHCVLIKRKFSLNLFVGNAIIDMYAKSGALKEARQQFQLLKNRDNVSWNAIIVGLVQENEEQEAFNMFQTMILSGILPDEVSLATILSACANLQAIQQGRQVHCFSVKMGLETSLYAGSSLIDMYSKCGIIEAAREVYCQMPERSVVSMNALISGYAGHDLEEAIDLFREMQATALNPSEVTFASLLDACDGAHRLGLGRQIHCSILKRGICYYDDFLGVSLLSMYLNSQEVTDASNLFSEFPDPKSTVLWTAFISGHTHNNCSEEALHFFQQMRSNNVSPDQASFVSVLRACAVLSSLRDGKEIHSLIFHTGFDLDELTCSALVDMYSKCGDISSAALLFSEMGCKDDVITWNSMIVGFAKNGYAEDALRVFEDMKETRVMPDDITFLGVLTACSHTGRVFEGREIFDVMVNHYGIPPRVDHCACMVDLLGRWGYLREAEEFIEKLDFKPNAMIWASLLGACKIHGDDKRGRRAAEKLIELEPQNSSPYVLLSNIYATSGNWDEVNYLRRTMREKGVKKFPGCSWIVVGEKTNIFVAGDKCHPSAGAVHEVLKCLTDLMKEEGYVAETDYFSYDEEAVGFC